MTVPKSKCMVCGKEGKRLCSDCNVNFESVIASGVANPDFDSVITVSGVTSAWRVESNDEAFMVGCQRRVQENGDKNKCDLCSLRFKCYTLRSGSEPVLRGSEPTLLARVVDEYIKRHTLMKMPQ